MRNTFDTPGSSVESSACFEGNDTILLFERIRSENIYKQILFLLTENEKSKESTRILVVKTNSEGKEIRDAAGVPELENRLYVSLSDEQIEKDLEERIMLAESSTDFVAASHPYESSNGHTMVIGALLPWSDKPFSEKQMSIAEAHEKGHTIRPYDGPFFNTYFNKAFNFESTIVTDQDIEVFRKVLEGEEKELPDEEMRTMYIEYISKPVEITERMSQLKNYFGMNSDECFTKEHLTYARAHYVADTDMDNGMGVFFRAINTDTEDAFIELINRSGI